MDRQDDRDDAGDDAEAGRTVRARSRDSLLLMANVRVADTAEVQTVRVRNLSAGGLMAEFAEPIDPDARVEVEVRGIGWIKGRVAWQAEGRVGLAFDKAVDPQRARKPVGTGSGATDRARPRRQR